MKSSRTHDQFYLRENRYEEPKESFKFLLQLARAGHGNLAGLTLCDVGCAAGELPYYLRKELPEAHIEGYDLLPELIEKARRIVPSVDFHTGSVLDPELMPEYHADILFLSGVIGIFDEFESCLCNLIRWLKPGGRAYVFGLFNSRPVDVLVKARRSKDSESDSWEPGWNIFSAATVGKFLNEQAVPVEHRFHDFSIGIELTERSDDPLRSWTERLADGRLMIVNGLCIVHDFKVLEIVRR